MSAPGQTTPAAAPEALGSLFFAPPRLYEPAVDVDVDEVVPVVVVTAPAMPSTGAEPVAEAGPEDRAEGDACGEDKAEKTVGRGLTAADVPGPADGPATPAPPSAHPAVASVLAELVDSSAFGTDVAVELSRRAPDDDVAAVCAAADEYDASDQQLPPLPAAVLHPHQGLADDVASALAQLGFLLREHPAIAPELAWELSGLAPRMVLSAEETERIAVTATCLGGRVSPARYPGQGFVGTVVEFGSSRTVRLLLPGLLPAAQAMTAPTPPVGIGRVSQ